MMENGNSQSIHTVANVTTLRLQAHEMKPFKGRPRYKVVLGKKAEASKQGAQPCKSVGDGVLPCWALPAGAAQSLFLKL